MLEKLSEVLKKTTNRIANAIFLDKNLIDSIVKDLQRILIEADVNVALVKDLSDSIRNGFLDEKIKGIEKKEHLIKLLHDELLVILGEEKKLELVKKNRILLLGLYGVGKTTTIAKMGNYYAKRGKKVALVGLDIHRPAAIEQLEQLSKKHNLSCFVEHGEKNPKKIWKKYSKELEKYDVVLIDTAGRHTLDKELISEIKDLNKEINPTELVLVMSADIGQAAKKQAQEFKDAVNISGVIVTRMDSTAKAGGVLTACNEVKAPIYFITTGEKINDIEEFNPKRFLARLLGMGDLEALIEKVKSVSDERKNKKIQKNIEEGKLSLDDVIEQVKSMSSLGGISKIKTMIPGFANAEKKLPENLLESQEQKILKWEHIIKSMTLEERENPEILKNSPSRISRIAKGAGVNNSNIRSLLKQYDMLNEMIKSSDSFDPSKPMSQKQMMKLAKKFAKGGKIKF